MEGDGEGKEVKDEEYRRAIATRTKESGVPKKQDKAISLSSWLLILSSEEIREAQLCDPCLGAVISLKEQGPEQPAWETISMESPTLKGYWAQWSLLVVRDGVLFRK